MNKTILNLVHLQLWKFNFLNTKVRETTLLWSTTEVCFSLKTMLNSFTNYVTEGLVLVQMD